MKSILPIIFIVLALTGAITYTLAKRSVPLKTVNSVGISANQLETDVTPTPTQSKKVTFGNLVATPTPTPTVAPSTKPTPTVTLPVVTEKETTKGDETVAQTVSTTTTTKTLVCTPVYGSANVCTEHIVVNTGAENALFFNFAGLAYIGGLMSFVKAKSLKR